MGSEYHNEEFDVEAQQAARDAVMEIRAFPELLTRLTRVFGPGPERDIVHQLVYWFSKPKMQNRWTAYLTRENWRDQRGLNRKQVDKGRRRLKAHPSGVVEEKLGPYKRVHYRIDWVKLADLLGLETPLEGVPMDDDFDLFDDVIDEEDLRPPLKGGPKPSAPPLEVAGSSAPPEMDDATDIYAENVANGGVPSNTGALAEAFSQDNHPTGCAEPAFAEPAPPKINKEIEPIEGSLSSPPIEDKRYSENGDASSAEEPVRVEDVGPPKPGHEALLDEVRDILDPDSGKWWGAKFIADRRKDYAPGAVVTIMLNSVEEIEEPGAITEANKTKLLEAVRYVMWEAEEEVG
jgi:hypothetical protein